MSVIRSRGKSPLAWQVIAHFSFIKPLVFGWKEGLF
jgi:hypothetical protein